MKQQVLTSIPYTKLPWTVRILFGVGKAANGMIIIMTTVFSLFFYVDLCGIHQGVAATIILVARIWDIVNDPMMGAIVDRTKSKEGRCRFWLKYFSLPGGILLFLSFTMPNFATTGKIIWFALFYTLQGMAQTALLIPTNTLIGRLTSDPVERALLNQIGGIWSLLPNLIVGSLTMPLVQLFGAGDMKKGFFYVAAIYGVIYALFNLIVFFSTRGYEPVEHLGDHSEIETSTTQKVPFSAVLKALLANTPWLMIIALYMIDMIVVSIGSNVMTFYYTYNIPNGIAVMSTVSVIGLVCALIPYLVMHFFIKKLGNAGTAAFGAIVTVIGYCFRFLMHDASVLVILVGYSISALGSTFVASTVVLMIFDAKIYGEWKTGVGNEALLMSGYSISYKTGQSLGGAIAGYMLLLVPYVAQAATQEQSVLDMFFYQQTLIPALGFVVVFVLSLLLMKNEKRIPQMKAEIEARKTENTGTV